MPNPISWFEIYVDDMPRAKDFYEAVFGVQLEKIQGDSIDMWSFPMDVNGYGSSGALVYMPGFPAGRNSVIVYFHSEDCAIEVEKAKQAGGRIQKDKMSIGPYGFIALIIDVEGNIIGVHSMK